MAIPTIGKSAKLIDIAGGNATWYNQYGKQLVSFDTAVIKPVLAIYSIIPVLAIYSGEIKTQVHTKPVHLYNIFTHNHQD